MEKARVAVLYQALDPPVINGVRKPPKPGGIFSNWVYLVFRLMVFLQDTKIPVLTLPSC